MNGRTKNTEQLQKLRRELKKDAQQIKAQSKERAAVLIGEIHHAQQVQKSAQILREEMTQQEKEAKETERIAREELKQHQEAQKLAACILSTPDHEPEKMEGISAQVAEREEVHRLGEQLKKWRQMLKIRGQAIEKTAAHFAKLGEIRKRPERTARARETLKQGEEQQKQPAKFKAWADCKN